MKRENDRLFFEGRCPYTDKPCDLWECDECEVEQREKEYMQNMEDKT